MSILIQERDEAGTVLVTYAIHAESEDHDGLVKAIYTKVCMLFPTTLFMGCIIHFHHWQGASSNCST